MCLLLVQSFPGEIFYLTYLGLYWLCHWFDMGVCWLLLCWGPCCVFWAKLIEAAVQYFADVDYLVRQRNWDDSAVSLPYVLLWLELYLQSNNPHVLALSFNFFLGPCRLYHIRSLAWSFRLNVDRSDDNGDVVTIISGSFAIPFPPLILPWPKDKKILTASNDMRCPLKYLNAWSHIVE